VRLRSLELDLEHPGDRALRPLILAALAPHGRPLRWAITQAGDGRLRVEAVVIEALADPSAHPSSAHPSGETL
jgi:hypothetical protein